MPQLDRLKEQVAYLKFWQGIMVVTDISLMGWLASNFEGTDIRILVVAVIGVVLLGIGIFAVHRRIERRIDQIGEI